MIQWFSSLAPWQQALLATLFTWGVTAAGASVVFFFKNINKNVMDALLGFAAGVMIAASFWSLLLPAADMAQTLGMSALPVLLFGFLSGGGLLFVGDKIYSALERENASSPQKKRCALLIFSITLHNIPEGLCVGVAFGSLAYGLSGANLAAACLLALGIGLQNFPEGTAVSVPLRREGASRRTAFFWGQISGAAEPFAAVFGALLVMCVRAVLPFSLAFAAGAMIYVVASELLPECAESREACAAAVTVGFSLMMLMDTLFG